MRLKLEIGHARSNISKLITLITVIGLATLMPVTSIALANGGTSGEPLDSLRNEYLRAIEHTSVWRNDDVKPLRPLIFDADGTVEVVTVIADPTIESPLKEEKWVTAAPDLRNFCRRLTTDVVMGMRQILGLPPDAPIRYVASMRVKAADIFRPTPDPNVFTKCPCGDKVDALCHSASNDNCGNAFPDTVSDDHRRWFLKTLMRNRRLPDGYPWTHLGYTYNWHAGTSSYGLSEYVIHEKATVALGAVVPVERYCAAREQKAAEAQKHPVEPSFAALSLLMVTQSNSPLVELVPSGPTMPPVPPGKSPWAGGVTLAAQFLGWLSDVALKSSIDARIKSLNKQIDAAMPRTGGVLIVIGIQQSAQPDNNGRYFRSVLDGYVGGAGTTAKATMETYLAKDRLEQGVPAGFARRNIYLWKSSATD